LKILKRHSYEHSSYTFDISVFIDVFRASTSLLCLFHQGVKEVILPQKDDLIPSLLTKEFQLVSEVYSEGLDNSPSQILNSNLKGKKIMLRTTNLTTVIINNSKFKHAVVAGFANIGAIVQYIQNLNPATTEIIMASHYEKNQVALEDKSCADMLEGLLYGEYFSEIPNLNSIKNEIENRKKSKFYYPEHYWNDLNLAMRIDSIPIVPRILKENKEVIRFVLN